MIPTILKEDCHALVLGVGNILWADEGFGVRCAEHFHNHYALPEGSRVLDGGTLGMYLLDILGSCEDLLLFDCAELHAEPGYLKVLRDEEVRLWSTTKLSAHQQGLNELLALAELTGHSPKRLAVIAVQPKELQDYGGSLTDALRPQVAVAVEKAVDILHEWGYEVRKREDDEKVAPLGDSSLVQDVYETLRPSEEEANRLGDIRFIPKHMLSK